VQPAKGADRPLADRHEDSRGLASACGADPLLHVNCLKHYNFLSATWPTPPSEWRAGVAQVRGDDGDPDVALAERRGAGATVDAWGLPFLRPDFIAARGALSVSAWALRRLLPRVRGPRLHWCGEIVGAGNRRPWASGEIGLYTSATAERLRGGAWLDVRPMTGGTDVRSRERPAGARAPACAAHGRARWPTLYVPGECRPFSGLGEPGCSGSAPFPDRRRALAGPGGPLQEDDEQHAQHAVDQIVPSRPLGGRKADGGRISSIIW